MGKGFGYIRFGAGVAVALVSASCGLRDVDLQTPPATYSELINLPPAEVERLDIALINLLCAKGLPDAESINITECLDVLDQWAGLVRQNEEKYSGNFLKNRQKYDHSYAKYQAVNLGLTIKEDLKCTYNKDLVRSGAMLDVNSTRFFKSPSDLFLHGFVENRTGSCSSLPVLMVSLGRRCGYPLYLVTCKGHLFCRWDDGKERFNIETACPGVDSRPDDYYRQWPQPSSEEEVINEGYLKNLDSTEELAVFSQLRAACLQEHKRYKESIEAYVAALKGFPSSTYLKSYVGYVQEEMKK